MNMYTSANEKGTPLSVGEQCLVKSYYPRSGLFAKTEVTSIPRLDS